VLAVRLVGRTSASGCAAVTTCSCRARPPGRGCSACTRSSRPRPTGGGSAHTLGLGAVSIALLVGFVGPGGEREDPLRRSHPFARATSRSPTFVQMRHRGMFGMFCPGQHVNAAMLGTRPFRSGWHSCRSTVVSGVIARPRLARSRCGRGAGDTLQGLESGAGRAGEFAQGARGRELRERICCPR